MRAKRNRGSALVVALLFILILTFLGIGVAYLASTEDRISGNEKILKAGFYAAEAGLRAGESQLGSFVSGGGNADTLLTGTTYAPPGGGWTAYLLIIGGNAVQNVKVQTLRTDPNARGIYTLYVRNNQDDPSLSQTQERDGKLCLISVGEYVTVDSSGNIVTRGIQKVLEEEVSLSALGATVNSQKGVNPAGTGSGTF